MSSPDEPPGGHEAPPWGAERYSPSSYAYKPPWAQPHYPLIPAQRTGPPAELGQPAEQPPAPSARKRWLLGCLIALLLVVLLGVVAVLWMNRSPGSSPASGPGATGRPPGPPVQSAQAAREAVAVWYRNGAQALLATVNRDLDAASVAAGAGDWPAMQQACRSLRRDVESAQAYRPSPDPEHAEHLSAALDEFARAATDCVSGTTENSGELLSRAGAELSTASGELERATARVKAINGN